MSNPQYCVAIRTLGTAGANITIPTTTDNPT